jgi:hypothetical protein
LIVRRSLLVLKLLLVAGVPALATPWWEAYEGDVFPEDQGWKRVHGSIPAQRWIDNGVLFIDSRADVRIYDGYEMVFGHPVDPGLGETFVLRWRLKVDEEHGPFYDAEIGITSDEAGPNTFYAAAFGFAEDRVFDAYQLNLWTPFEPGVFHDFEMRSSDMRAYLLYIDGALAMTGAFTEVFGPARVAWGDGVQGSTSLTEWDNVRFGVVVPEGSALSSALLIGAFLRGARGGLARA